MIVWDNDNNASKKYLSSAEIFIVYVTAKPSTALFQNDDNVSATPFASHSLR